MINDDHGMCFKEVTHTRLRECLLNERFGECVDDNRNFAVGWPVFFNPIPALNVVHVFWNIDRTVQLYVFACFGEELFKCSSLDKLLIVWADGRYKVIPPPDKFFVDKDHIYCGFYTREKLFTAVYTEPEYGFTYIKRFAFGGLIQNKEYRFAPEKSAGSAGT